MFKKFIQRRLEKSVTKYFKKHPEVRLVVVAGSVGKTTTKVAIATVLAEKYRVRVHEGNHNSEISAPLALLGIAFPESLRSPVAWLKVLLAAHQRIRQPADVDVVVQELGTDGIGQIPHFGTYLNPDIAVVTSVSAEHMEFFGTLDAIAEEELAAANFSKFALINRDDIDGRYAQDVTTGQLNTYGTTEFAEYRFTIEDYQLATGYTGFFVAPEFAAPLPVQLKVMGEHSVRALVAAGAVGVKLGLSETEIAAGLGKMQAVSGRMNVLRGVNESIIIDDTYNSSPLAVESALRTLYSLSMPQKIAVLGSMNELGELSPQAHEAIGLMCDPSELAHVITVGEEAAKYLAPAARSRGCHVESFANALQAGAYAHKVLEHGGAALFKGSQGGIFLEEAVKVVLHGTDDEDKLVRQSPAWLEKKRAYFDQSQATD